VAVQRNIGESKLYADQRNALRRLAEVVAVMEQEALAARRHQLERWLEPPNYTALFGIDALLDQFWAQVTGPGPPWLIAITGIGGIGKTTLADALVRRAIHAGQWEGIGWVSARANLFHLGGAIRPAPKPALTTPALVDALRPQLLPEHEGATLTANQTLMLLAQRLTGQPFLIVIDNLETVLDLESLLPVLRRLVNPTRFLLTTRAGLHGEPDIYQVTVPELHETAAYQLIRHEAAMRNTPELPGADDDRLRPIYAAVGGNPLALRLVVGQAYLHPLSLILDDLAALHTRPMEQLYTFIYRRAWDGLDELQRRVLLALPLAPPQGGTFDRLLAVTRLTASELHSGLDGLLALNLVDSRGDLQERRYTIHQLTRTFLQHHVAQWQL
jgi:hypothetical protein